MRGTGISSRHLGDEHLDVGEVSGCVEPRVLRFHAAYSAAAAQGLQSGQRMRSATATTAPIRSRAGGTIIRAAIQP